ANLPYYITSPIIMKLLEDELPIDSITVMVQKEAATRLTAELGTREVGAITVAVRYYSEPKILFNVSKGSFMPVPKVDSSVIRLDIHKGIGANEKDDNDEINRDDFFRVVKASFAQRRKTLLNSLSSGLAIDKQEVRAILGKAGIRENMRAEQLAMNDFKEIAKQI
ncbi:MAG: 16S rRNA (adenine(1518)-N(6)/adenine(1519)-N(6))-dimethyltransferase, partial [Clostridiales bacterium]|nr:16S rRNA (adenine(1518)-N(6)/adenine(1519)-N(6))-dimethyltransferase [Clostridiales bacterium]